jgi:hypothetical protein
MDAYSSNWMDEKSIHIWKEAINIFEAAASDSRIPLVGGWARR